MESRLNTVAFIPVRGGSKSIPLKNIKPMAGKPLVQWTVEAAVHCDGIDRVFVATDSDVIRNIVERFGYDKVTVIGRSEASASDTAPSETALLEFAQAYSFQHVVMIQATSPLLTSFDLSQALKIYHSSSYDSLLSVVRQKRFIWSVDERGQAHPVNYDYRNRPRRQEFAGFLVENGAFYITGRDGLLRSGCRLSGTIGCYEMDEASYVEIDEETDWQIAEQLLKRYAGNEGRHAKAERIKLFITDCDGVLTDGGMYYSEHGDELKKFHTRDAAGLRLLKEAGIVIALVTGEDVGLVRRRASKIGIEEVYCGVNDKVPVVGNLLEKYGVSWEETAYIGDDLNDLEVMRRAGLSFAVQDAVAAVKEQADYVTQKKGGEGAVREAAEFILAHRGQLPAKRGGTIR